MVGVWVVRGEGDIIAARVRDRVGLALVGEGGTEGDTREVSPGVCVSRALRVANDPGSCEGVGRLLCAPGKLQALVTPMIISASRQMDRRKSMDGFMVDTV